MKYLPEGFQYSKEAQRSLRTRARQADKRIKELCRNNPELRARVNQIFQLLKKRK
jgi:hypothetical protein